MTSAAMHPLTHLDVHAAANSEPRILDLRLAEVLGFEKIRDIRSLIQRHESALERLGEVCRTVRQTSVKGGRPTSEYHLNKKQAIYICSKSETANAVDITLHVIQVFDAVSRGEPVAAPATPAVEAPEFSDEETLHLVSLRMRGMRILTTMKDGLQSGSRLLKDSECVVDMADQADISRFVERLNGAQLSLLSLYIWGKAFGKKGVVSFQDGKMPLSTSVRRG